MLKQARNHLGQPLEGPNVFGSTVILAREKRRLTYRLIGFWRRACLQHFGMTWRVAGCRADDRLAALGYAGAFLPTEARDAGTDGISDRSPPAVPPGGLLLMAVLDVDRLRAYAVPELRESYDRRDAILYALGTGAGLSDAVDELAFVFERQLVALPTMALVLGTPGFWLMDPRAGLDWTRILHGGQSLRLFRPLEPEGELVGHIRIGELADKGAEKSALLRAHRTLKTPSGVVVAEMTETWVLRGAGGFGGVRNLDDAPDEAVIEGPADASLDLPTARNQAMLYRLSGDRNPLHIEPQTAALGDFPRPILHGLSTMGLVGRALVHLACAGDPRRLSSMRVRFAAPVFPGETIRTQIWRRDDAILFRAIAIERDQAVIEGGHATIDAF
jgi:acyl dehydratase